MTYVQLKLKIQDYYRILQNQTTISDCDKKVQRLRTATNWVLN